MTNTWEKNQTKTKKPATTTKKTHQETPNKKIPTQTIKIPNTQINNDNKIKTKKPQSKNKQNKKKHTTKTKNHPTKQTQDKVIKKSALSSRKVCFGFYFTLEIRLHLTFVHSSDLYVHLPISVLSQSQISYPTQLLLGLFSYLSLS